MRGGVPRVLNISIDVTGRFVQFAALSEHVTFRTDNLLRVYFSLDDFTNNANFFEVDPGVMLPLPMEDRGVWLRAVAGVAAVTLIIIHRKG